MKLSARNQLKGKVVEVHKGATTAHVVVDLGHGVRRHDRQVSVATVGRRHDSPSAPPHRLRLTSAKPLRISFAKVASARTGRLT